MTRTLRPFAVFGFESTHAALDAEQLLLDLGIDVVPIPAPKSIGTNCGIALRVEQSEGDRAEEYLQSAGLAPAVRVSLEDI